MLLFAHDNQIKIPGLRHDLVLTTTLVLVCTNVEMLLSGLFVLCLVLKSAKRLLLAYNKVNLAVQFLKTVIASQMSRGDS